MSDWQVEWGGRVAQRFASSSLENKLSFLLDLELKVFQCFNARTPPFRLPMCGFQMCEAAPGGCVEYFRVSSLQVKWNVGKPNNVSMDASGTPWVRVSLYYQWAPMIIYISYYSHDVLFITYWLLHNGNWSNESWNVVSILLFHCACALEISNVTHTCPSATATRIC